MHSVNLRPLLQWTKNRRIEKIQDGGSESSYQYPSFPNNFWQHGFFNFIRCKLVFFLHFLWLVKTYLHPCFNQTITILLHFKAEKILLNTCLSLNWRLSWCSNWPIVNYRRLIQPKYVLKFSVRAHWKKLWGN